MDRSEIRKRIRAELEANAWLQTTMVVRFESLEDAIRDELTTSFTINAIHAGKSKSDRDVLVQDQMASMKGVLRGRLIRPVLRHLFLLNDHGVSDEQLKFFSSKTAYPYDALSFHFRREGGIQLPEAFLRKFFVVAMKGDLPNEKKSDISNGSAAMILRLLVKLKYAERVSCVRGDAAYALVFTEEFFDLVEVWFAKKGGF